MSMGQGVDGRKEALRFAIYLFHLSQYPSSCRSAYVGVPRNLFCCLQTAPIPTAAWMVALVKRLSLACGTGLFSRQFYICVIGNFC